MKTFLLSIPAVLRQANVAIDAKSVLCAKSWIVVNDAGIKQFFFFDRNGKLKIVTDGDVYLAEWEFEARNKSIIIYEANTNEGVMFRPIYSDDVIMALEKFGTDNFLCLVDDQIVTKFKNLLVSSGIYKYLDDKTAKSSSQSDVKNANNAQNANNVNNEGDRTFIIVIISAFILLNFLIFITTFIFG